MNLTQRSLLASGLASRRGLFLSTADATCRLLTLSFVRPLLDGDIPNVGLLAQETIAFRFRNHDDAKPWKALYQAPLDETPDCRF